MKLALAQMDPVWEDKEKNKQICKRFIQKAKDLGVDLITFPEMTLTGFTMNVKVTAETIFKGSSLTLDFFREEAKKAHINIGFGMVEDQSPAKNKYYIVDDQGIIQLDYAKIHAFSYGEEEKHFKGGDQIKWCEIKDTRISTFICYDLRFPEVFAQASPKADLILVASNWPKTRINHFTTLLKARAIENQCYIAGINRVGIGNTLEYPGASAIYDLDANNLSTFVPLDNNDTIGLLIADINSAEVNKRRAEFKVKADRREDLYHTFYLKKD